MEGLPLSQIKIVNGFGGSDHSLLICEIKGINNIKASKGSLRLDKDRIQQMNYGIFQHNGFE